MYLLSGVFTLVGLPISSQVVSRRSTALFHFALGGFWLAIYYFECTQFAGYLRDEGYLWPGIALLVGVNYVALDLLYGWWLSRRIVGGRQSSDISILR